MKVGYQVSAISAQLCTALVVGCLLAVLSGHRPAGGPGTAWVTPLGVERGRRAWGVSTPDRRLVVSAAAPTPNRLARAKSDMQDLLQVLQQEGGHRLGLVVFAGQASLQCPLTMDYGFFLQRLHQVGPDTVVRGGTLIGDAIRKALSAFATARGTLRALWPWHN